MPKLTVSVSTRGTPAASFKRRFIRDIGQLTEGAARRVKDEALRLMNQPKSGRQYRNLSRQSSAPGEAPASQTGKLAGSFRIQAQGRHRLHRRIGTPLWYGNFLMTRRNRPVLQPALNKVFPDYLEEIKSMIGR